MIQSIHQDAEAFTRPVADFVRSAHRSAAIGLISPKELEQVSLDDIQNLVGRLAGLGIAVRANLQWQVSLERGALPQGYWHGVAQALDESPVPQAEWKSARDLFEDDELLTRLTGAARSSVVRYLKGDRSTPDTVAERLHAVMMLAADLQGTLNARGVRRWFTKKRSLLEGNSPLDLLGEDWSTDSEGYARVRQLADSDLNFQAT